MSSSAITPVNIEITNNVPTNVPVVEAWQSYTPTVSNNGNKSFSTSGRWRRVGDSMELRFSLNGNTTSSGSTSGTSFTFSLPSGLSIDATKLSQPTTIDDAQNNIGYASTYGISGSGIYDRQTSVIPFNTTSLRFVNPGTGGVISTSTLNTTADIDIQGTVVIPIAEWAGTGTTTLANRAVEEYGSSTTGTWDAPAAVGNTVLGPGGSPITGDLSAVRSKNSRFSSTIQSTDWLILEFRNTAGNWIPSHLTNSSFLSAPPTFFGAYISSVSGTDVQVTFAQYAYPGATWGSTTGAGGWSASDAKAWRVRKVSSGAQVGYPVSARNIVGDTSGSAVPTGMIGEVVTWTTAPIDQAATSTTTDWNNATISLSAGVWLIQVGVQVSLTGQSVAGGNNIAVSLTTSSNSVLRTIYPLSTNVINSNYGGFGTIVNTVNITATTSYKIRFNVLTTNNGGSGSILNTANQSYFYAVRIA